MDILIGNGRSTVRNDFSSNWDNSPKLGKVEAGDDFLLAPGRYGLSLFVEGDQINYSLSGQFL